MSCFIILYVIRTRGKELFEKASFVMESEPPMASTGTLTREYT